MTKANDNLIELEDDTQKSEIDDVKLLISHTNTRLDELFQKFHDKGLEVGMPRKIRHDIQRIVGVLNKTEKIWNQDSIDSRKKQRDEDEEIKKLMNKGEEFDAYRRLYDQIRELRDAISSISLFLNVLTYELNALESELERTDS